MRDPTVDLECPAAKHRLADRPARDLEPVCGEAPVAITLSFVDVADTEIIRKPSRFAVLGLALASARVAPLISAGAHPS